MLCYPEATSGCIECIQRYITARSWLKRLTQRRLAGLFFVFFFALLTLFSSAKAQTDNATTPIRIGITPVILGQQLQVLQQWQSYLEASLKQPIEFVQRDSYGKITNLLLRGELDFGWICGFPYVQHKAQLDLLAVPLYNGEPFYQAYLIVPNSDKNTRSIQDLQDTVFAYSDPDSNSGYLYAQYKLRKANFDPEQFFKTTFFTWKHRNTVEAVAVGLANAGIVDGYIWETLKLQRNALAAKTRVADKSKSFGFPPFVASRHAPSQLKKKLQNILLAMTNTSDGKKLLKQLNITGFSKGNAHLYDSILQMHLFVEENHHAHS